MFWNQFENDRDALRTQYSEPHWDETSGLSPKDLQEKLLQIEKDYADKGRMVTKSKMVCAVLENAQLAIDPRDFFPDLLNHDDIIGRIRGRWIRQTRKTELYDLLTACADEQEGLCYTGNCDFGHTSPDWDAVMRLGLVGLRTRIRAAREKNTAEDAQTFYACAEETLTACIDCIARLAAACRQTGGEKMEYVADSLDILTRGAPTTLLSAMQLSLLYYMFQFRIEVVNLRSLGGLDRLFYPFYKADIEAGRLTEDNVRELFSYYFWKCYSMKVNANVPFYIGGRKADGTDAVNDLTYLIADTYIALDVDDPKIHVLYHKDFPADLAKKILASIRDGKSSFVFINSEVVEEALIKLGEDPADARNFTVIGCYEPCALGKEVPCTCNGRVNLAKAIETVLNGGDDPYVGGKVGCTFADASTYTDFDAFYTAVKTQIRYFCERAMQLVSAFEENYDRMTTAPLLSSTYLECVERGQDAYLGGAKYNNSSINALFIASATDALCAIRKLVFEDKKITLPALRDLLKNNWEGGEALRFEALHHCPKYGNNDPAADEIAKDLCAYVASVINHHKNGRGGVFRLGLFTIDWRIVFGERTGATADGRRAGEMLSKNMCAMTAMDREGVTALISSATTIDYKNVPNGTVLDVMLHSSAAEGEAGLCAMHGLLATFMQKGGFAIQFNVFAPGILRAAQREPERYANLQVRLCGWNVYFNELTKPEQDDLIRQFEAYA